MKVNPKKFASLPFIDFFRSASSSLSPAMCSNPVSISSGNIGADIVLLLQHSQLYPLKNKCSFIELNPSFPSLVFG